MLFEALTLQLGYNASLVAIGAALLGFAAGASGSFLFLRKRALVSDAISHATLPGIALAFMLMVAMGGDGRNLLGLLLGSALSAWAGLLVIQWLTQHTRLREDAAIGAVLSVFFGFGVVLLTIIQTFSTGRQAGLQDFLLGATAGMLYADAITIIIGGALAVLAVIIFRRPMTLVAFDASFAAANGYPVRLIDLGIMALVLAVTIVGLKIVGLILIVALLIIPPVTARLWTNRVNHLIWLSAFFGASAGFLGSAVSATAPALPTGPIIVLVAFALFVFSLLFSPIRGVLARGWQRYDYQNKRLLRQSLLARLDGQPVFDTTAIRLLRRYKLTDANQNLTSEGLAMARQFALDEARWRYLREYQASHPAAGFYDGHTPLEQLVSPTQLAQIDQQRTDALKRVDNGQ